MESKTRNVPLWHWRSQFNLECNQKLPEASRVATETGRPIRTNKNGTDVIATSGSSSYRKGVFLVGLLDGSSRGAIKLFIVAITILLLLLICCCPKVQTLAVVGHISSSAANMAAAAASLLVAQGLQLEQQPVEEELKSEGSQQQYKLTFEPDLTDSSGVQRNGSLSLFNIYANRTGSEQMYAERRNFGQRIPLLQNITESTFLGQLANPFKLNMMPDGLEGNWSGKKEGAGNKLKIISRLLQYRLPRPNATLFGNLTNKLSAFRVNSTNLGTAKHQNSTIANSFLNHHQTSSLLNSETMEQLNEGNSERDSLLANSSSRDYQVVKLVNELQPGATVTLEVNGSLPDNWQESNNIEQVIRVGSGHENEERTKKEADEEEENNLRKSEGSRKIGKQGDELHGYEEADNWLKQKHGEQGNEGSRIQGALQGDKMLKSAGHKRHGWKNIYHKEEYAQHQKYHDLLENKDSHDQSSAKAAQEHFNVNSKFNDTESGIKFNKDDHGSKYEYTKGSQWRRDEDDNELKQKQQVGNSISKLQGVFSKKKRANRKHDLKTGNNHPSAFEETSGSDIDQFTPQTDITTTTTTVAATNEPETQPQTDDSLKQADLESEEPIKQMKDKLERLSDGTNRYKGAKRFTSSANPFDSRAASEQTNYAATSPDEHADYDDERDWSIADALAARRQHESINDILKTVKASGVPFPKSKGNSVEDDHSGGRFGNSSGSNLLASSISELEPDDEDSYPDGEQDGDPAEMEPPPAASQKAPKKNEQIRLKLELDLGKSMGSSYPSSNPNSGKGEKGRRPVNGTKAFNIHQYTNLSRAPHPFATSSNTALHSRRRHFSQEGNRTMSGAWRSPRPPIQRPRPQQSPLDFPIPAQQPPFVVPHQPFPGSGTDVPEHIEKAHQFYPQPAQLMSSGSNKNNESRWSKAIGEPSSAPLTQARYSPAISGQFGLQDGQLAGYRGDPPTRRPIPANPSVLSSWNRFSVQNVGPANWNHPTNSNQHHVHPPQPQKQQQQQQQQQKQSNLIELSQILPARPIFVKHLQMNGGVVLGRLQSNNKSEPPQSFPQNQGMMMMMNPSHQSVHQQPQQQHHSVMSALPLGLAEDLSLESSLNHPLGDQLFSSLPLEPFPIPAENPSGRNQQQHSPIIMGAANQRGLRDYLAGLGDMGSESSGHPHELSVPFDGLTHHVDGLMDMENLLSEADNQQMMLSAFSGHHSNQVENDLEQSQQLHQPISFDPAGNLLQDPLSQPIITHQSQLPAASYLFPFNQQPQESALNPALFTPEQQQQQHYHGSTMIPTMQHTLARLLKLSRVFGAGVVSIPGGFLTSKHQLLPSAAHFHDYHSLQRQFNMQPPATSNLLSSSHRRTPAIPQQQQTQYPFGHVKDKWPSVPHALHHLPTQTTAVNQPPTFGHTIHPNLSLQQPDFGDLLGAHSKLIAASVSSQNQLGNPQHVIETLQHLRDPVNPIHHQTGKLRTNQQPISNNNSSVRAEKATSMAFKVPSRGKTALRMSHSEKLMLRKSKPDQASTHLQAHSASKFIKSEGGAQTGQSSNSGPINKLTSNQPLPTNSTAQKFTTKPNAPIQINSSNKNHKEHNSPLIMVFTRQHRNNNKQPLAWYNVPYLNGSASPSYLNGSQNGLKPSTHSPELVRSSTTTTTTTTPPPSTISPSSIIIGKTPFFGQKIFANFKMKIGNVTG